MKIVFMGTPEFAVEALKSLCEKHEVICVYTQMPKECGRGQKVQKSPVHVFAEGKGIEVRHPKTLRNEEEQAKFRAIDADMTVVAAYGLILPKPILEPFSCVNIHGSILPRWRGAAPIQRAIEAGDTVTGITIMEMIEALDAGKMYLKGEIAITPEMTGGELHDKMATLGAELIVKYLDNTGAHPGEVQDESLVTYAKKIDKAEGLIDFNLSASVLERKIRAFNPYPAAYFEKNGERFKVLKAKVSDEVKGLKPFEFKQENGRLFIGCNDVALEVLEIQRAGKKACCVSDFLRGYSFC